MKIARRNFLHFQTHFLESMGCLKKANHGIGDLRVELSVQRRKCLHSFYLSEWGLAFLGEMIFLWFFHFSVKTCKSFHSGLFFFFLKHTSLKDKDVDSLRGRGQICFPTSITKIMFLTGAKVELIC